MTPQQFIAKWGLPGGVAGPAYALNEEQGAQSHFLDLCELLDVPKPGAAEGYRFEEKSAVIGGKTGYADVFMRGVFAWENKAPGKNLDAALKQLLTYSLALSNPPILVVSDRLNIRIHTQFTGHPSQTHSVGLAELDQPDKLALLRRIWIAPESFKPHITNRDITEAAAKSFATLAEGLRRRGSALAGAPAADAIADQVAHFLTQCLFCFFAEDVGLLPGRMFERLVNNRQITAARLTHGLAQLFSTMQSGGLYGADDIPWFNGGLFKTVEVPTLSILDVTELRNAADLNWSAIDVAIFGTLFERGLDPAKRSQLGAHYTDTATIDRIIDPVLRRPLLQKWELVRQAVQGLMAKNIKRDDKYHREASRLFIEWQDFLTRYRVLDPACGSGNFLFLALKCLKDIELRSHLEAADLGLDRQTDLVTGPHNVLGIELNEYAAELARVTVWIGELQWRIAHGFELKVNPVLEPLDHIECRDALLAFPAIASVAWQSVSLVGNSEPGARAAQMPGAHTLRFLKSPPTSAPPTRLSDLGVHELEVRLKAVDLTPVRAEPVEAQWPQANVVIGNPPFLGDRKMIRELGEKYTFALRKAYEGRVPGGADLVCYWFEKARTAIESHGLDAAGLVATNSIRGGANRKVRDSICQSTRIVEAWSDEGWVNEGAAVRVSLIAFGHAIQSAKLDGVEVSAIAADLSAQDLTGLNDLTTASKLAENTNASFIGTQKNGPFDIVGQLARDWLKQPNPNGISNAKVLRPWINGIAVTRRAQDLWVIDFDKMSETDACLFELPFTKVVREVKPTRMELRRDWHRLHWWCHGDPRPAMKLSLRDIPRQIISPRVSKHRVFAWFSSAVLPDSAVVTIARADDTTFGILHSRFHELWSLRMCTWLGVGNDPRYTPTTCFETFPFPAGLTPFDTAHQRTEIVEGGAQIPADLPGNWGQILNSPETMSASGHAKLESDPKFPTAVAHQHAPVGVVRMSGAISKSEAYEPPASEPAPPGAHQPSSTVRANAIKIAQAAKKLNDLRESWLNPPEWTHKVPEVTPLGMTQSPYPERIEPQTGLSEQDLKALQKRTLTNLYNAKPAWLTMAHHQLDLAVAAAYGWLDYSAAMPDDEILKRLLALNLARSATISTKTKH